MAEIVANVSQYIGNLLVGQPAERRHVVGVGGPTRWKNSSRPLQDCPDKQGSVARHDVIIGESGLHIGYAGAIDLMAGDAIGSIDLKPGSEGPGVTRPSAPSGSVTHPSMLSGRGCSQKARR